MSPHAHCRMVVPAAEKLMVDCDDGASLEYLLSKSLVVEHCRAEFKVREWKECLHYCLLSDLLRGILYIIIGECTLNKKTKSHSRSKYFAPPASFNISIVQYAKKDLVIVTRLVIHSRTVIIKFIRYLGMLLLTVREGLIIHV